MTAEELQNAVKAVLRNVDFVVPPDVTITSMLDLENLVWVLTPSGEPAWRMNAASFQLAGDLLGRAAIEFSHHAVTEWRWPEAWTLAEREACAVALYEANLGKPVADFSAEELAAMTQDYSRSDGLGPPDWWVMRFLADQLRQKE